MSNERLAILERFGDGDTQDLCAEVRRLRTALVQVQANANKARAEAKTKRSVSRWWLNVESILDRAGISQSGRDD